MVDGLDAGARPQHSLSAAASRIAGLLSERKPEEIPDESETQETDEQALEVSETDEVEQTEQVDDVEESPESEEGTDDETPQPRKLKVKVGDQEEEVTEDEVVKGYLRTKDYTQKTQALAEARKKFEQEELPAVQRERAELAESLTKVRTALENATPEEPDWDKLREENPAEFAETWAIWDQHKKRMQAIREKEEAAHQRVLADQAENFRKHLESEREKLLKALPEWSKPEVAKKEREELVAYAAELGFGEDELKQVYDHRLILMLRDAAAHRKAQQAKPAVTKKIVEATKKVVPPGAPKTKVSQAEAEITARRKRLAQTGSVDDAAALIASQLRGRSRPRKQG
jgi:hypothetical protein